MEEFAKDGLGWRIDLANRRFGEWVGAWLQSTEPSSEPNAPPWPFWELLGNVILIVLIVGTAFWLTRMVWELVRPYWLLWQGRDRDLDPSPATPTQSVEQWQQQARQYQRSGNYAQACLCLYLGMLQHLNDAGIAPHQPSRTDGEYQRLIAQHPHPTPYYTLLAMHQRLKFGTTAATSELVDRCLNAYAHFS